MFNFQFLKNIFEKFNLSFENKRINSPTIKPKTTSKKITKIKNSKVSVFIDQVSPIDEKGISKKITYHEKITNLLKKIQSGEQSISACIAEALGIAISIQDAELQLFCENELKGWPDKTKWDEIEHRKIEGYCSPIASVNMNSPLWNNNPDSVFEELEKDDNFKKILIYMYGSISSQENKTKSFKQNGVFYLKRKMSDFDEKAKNPDHTVHCYIDNLTYKEMIEKTKVELTKRLVDISKTI